MARRFSEISKPPILPGDQGADYVVFDDALGRWRWSFARALAALNSHLGRAPTIAEAAASLDIEMKLALQHIDTVALDGTVFGVLYDPAPAVRLKSANPAKTAESKRHANATVVTAMAHDTPDFMRDGFIGGAIGVLRHSLKLFDPNNLLASGAMVTLLQRTGNPVDALAEWADLYCRIASASRVLRTAKPSDPARSLVLDAYAESFTTVLPVAVESTARLLGAGKLFDPSRIAGLPLHASDLDDIAEYVDKHSVNWLRMVTASPTAMGYFQFGPGTVAGVGKDVATLRRVWHEAYLPSYPPRIAKTLSACVAALDSLLSLNIPAPLRSAEIRLAACDALAEIPTAETLAVATRHRAHADPAVRIKLEKLIGQLKVARLES